MDIFNTTLEDDMICNNSGNQNIDKDLLPRHERRNQRRIQLKKGECYNTFLKFEGYEDLKKYFLNNIPESNVYRRRGIRW